MKNRNVLVAIVVIGAAFVGTRFFLDRERDEPSGAPLVQVSVPPLSGGAKEGESLFNANCAECHGENAAGRDGAGRPFVHPVYQPGHHADGSFFLAVRNGAIAHHWRFGDMPPVEGITDSEIEKIVAYVRTMQQANGIN
ncbi:MAG: cytochrome c [Rhodobiaceae bacterium]|nr:cytochrome c [Rhodobiaceae bacterium]